MQANNKKLPVERLGEALSWCEGSKSTRGQRFTGGGSGGQERVHLLSPLFTAGNTELNECFKLLSSASSSFFWKWLHRTFASTENHDCRQMSSQSSDPTACFLSLIAPLSPKILLNGLLGKGMNIEKRRFLKNINKSVFTFKNIKS